MINKEVAQFIKAYKHLKLVNSCYNEAHQMIHTIESHIPFENLFPDFGNQGTYQIGMDLKIL